MSTYTATPISLLLVARCLLRLYLALATLDISFSLLLVVRPLLRTSLNPLGL
nr:MAG TPA: hypothetical protein [Caudoviricetes sp.]